VLDITDKTSFSIGASQTLMGGGTIKGDGGSTLTVSGTFTPGNSPGLFTYDGGTTILAGTTIMEILGTSRATQASHGTDPFYDAVNVINAGSLTFGGILEFAMTGDYADNTLFNLFTASGGSTLSGNFTGVSVTGSSSYAGLTFTNSPANLWVSGPTASGQTLTFNATDGTLIIVPEPGTLALAALGIVAGVAAYRRRRSNAGSPIA
jgi:hypothetical protein